MNAVGFARTAGGYTGNSPAMLATRDGIIAALTVSPGLADAWRINSQEVVESIRFCQQYMRTIAEADEMLTPTIRLHNPATVEHARKILPWRLSLYLEHVKGVSLAEQRMDEAGIAYALSSDDWRA